MIESHLHPGAQKFTPGRDDPAKLAYGISITDPCLGWEHTVEALRRAERRGAPPPRSLIARGRAAPARRRAWRRRKSPSGDRSTGRRQPIGLAR